jgi:hypothetical protein
MMSVRFRVWSLVALLGVVTVVGVHKLQQRLERGPRPEGPPSGFDPELAARLRTERPARLEAMTGEWEARGAAIAAKSTSLDSNELPETIDLERALALSDQRDYLAALRIVRPCVREEAIPLYPNLEDCLYEGGRILEKAAGSIPDQDIDPSATDEFRRLAALLPEINLEGYKYFLDYENIFHQALAARFPGSPRMAEVRYGLINADIAGDQGWQTWEQDLLDYLRDFPATPQAIRARLMLARIYDNIWQIMLENLESEPGEQEGYLAYMMSGDYERDSSVAESYRQHALSRYDEVLRDPAAGKDPAGDVEATDLQHVRQRRDDLDRRIKGHTFYILND